MDPTTIFCPNLACPARGQTGQGNIGIHSRKEQALHLHGVPQDLHAPRKAPRCIACGPRRRRSVSVVTLMAHGCPLQAIVVAFGSDERTVADWLARAGSQGQAVQEHLVEQPRDLGQVQADEIRVKTQGGIVWMALAMMVSTRLWLAGEVSEQRDMTLIRRLIERVRRCAAHRPLLFCTDGLCSYVRAIRETFRDPVADGRPGAPSVAPLAQHLHRTGREALCPAARGRRRAPHRGWHARARRDAQASLARRRRDQHGVHRAAERDIP